MKKYKFVGSIEPSFSSNQFTLSIFQCVETGEFAQQIIVKNKITSFIPVDLNTRLKNAATEIYADKGDPAIYSYIDDSRTLHAGTKEALEPLLLPLLRKEKVNDHSKLEISTFFNLYDKSIHFLKRSNDDFKNKGIKIKYNQKSLFAKKVKNLNVEKSVFNQIQDKYSRLRKYDQNIKTYDVVFLDNDNVFFDAYQFKIQEILNPELKITSGIKEVLSKSFNHAIGVNAIKLEKHIYDRDGKVYLFLMYSEFIDINQTKIESLISEEIKEDAMGEGESILDAGRNIDKILKKQMLEQIERPNSIYDENQTLEESCISIVHNSNLEEE